MVGGGTFFFYFVVFLPFLLFWPISLSVSKTFHLAVTLDLFLIF